MYAPSQKYQGFNLIVGCELVNHFTNNMMSKGNKDSVLGDSVENRELTNKNKHVFKRTHVCLCVYLCVLS